MFYVIDPEKRSQGVLGSIVGDGHSSLELGISACVIMSDADRIRKIPLLVRRQIIECAGLFESDQDVMADDILYLFTHSGQPVHMGFN